MKNMAKFNIETIFAVFFLVCALALVGCGKEGNDKGTGSAEKADVQQAGDGAAKMAVFPVSGTATDGKSVTGGKSATEAKSAAAANAAKEDTDPFVAGFDQMGLSGFDIQFSEIVQCGGQQVI